MFEDMGPWNPNFYIKSNTRILVIDDEPQLAEEMANYLRMDGHAVDTVTSAEAAIQAFVRKTYHLILIDVFLPGRSAIEFIHLLQESCAQCIVVLLIGPAPLQVPFDVLDMSTKPCLSKPISSSVLRKRIYDLLQTNEQEPQSRLFSLDRNQGVFFEGIRTRSQKMRELVEKIRMVAQTDTSVLITGEPGTGKELLARAIHNQSKRQKGPFLSVQTKTIPRDKMMTDLFGTDERGPTFDGAFRGKMGMAIGGTLFLDELLFLDNRTIQKFHRFLDATESGISNFRSFRSFDLRMIFSSHKNNEDGMGFYAPIAEFIDRVKPLHISIPPLRERPEDITPLAYDFLAFFSIQHRKLLGIIPVETRRLLEHYDWPGNIRELRQVMEQAVLLSRSIILEPELLPYRIYHAESGGKVIPIPLGWSLEQAEKEIIWRTLEAKNRNKKGTAETLGISRRSLYNKLAGYLEKRHRDPQSGY